VSAEDSVSSIDKELKIMSKVLEASLDATADEDWFGQGFGYSAFESKIKSEYIPTVGAIFTINVKFPIVKPEVESADLESVGAEPDDLWDRMADPKNSEIRFNQTGKISGIGVSIRKNGEDVLIGDTFEGSPASVAGISEGDIILEVEGKPVGGLKINDVAGMIQGREGSKVLITYRDVSASGGAGQEVEVILEREDIRVRPQGLLNIPQVELIDPNVYREWNDGQYRDRVRNRYRNQIIVDGNVTSLYFNDAEYDASKVDLFRKTILTAMARYGHRMTQLPASERALVRVVGPRSGGGRNRISTRIGRGAPVILGLPFNGDSDKLLFSFDKKDLEKGMTWEKLDKKIQPVQY
jgi:hypothetical protein